MATRPCKKMALVFICRNCEQSTQKLLKLPTPMESAVALISHVCENCFNVACNAELQIAQKRPLAGESDAQWLERCRAISRKYGFDEDDEQKICADCGQPRIHDPLCIECYTAEECYLADQEVGGVRASPDTEDINA